MKRVSLSLKVTLELKMFSSPEKAKEKLDEIVDQIRLELGFDPRQNQFKFPQFQRHQLKESVPMDPDEISPESLLSTAEMVINREKDPQLYSVKLSVYEPQLGDKIDKIVSIYMRH